MLIEGRHFRREWSGPRDIGGKAAARNLADVAAMGARPTALLVSFAGPGELEVRWVLELVAGIAQESSIAGAAVAGGDTSSADVVMLAVTALGDLDGRQPVTRGGARPGDVVAVTGSLGSAAAGLALLSAGLSQDDPGLEPLIRAHRRPRPPYDAGPQAADLGATAMIDVSDGLIADLSHVASASGVQIELRTSAIAAEPVAPQQLLERAAAVLDGPSPRQWVLTGGDDHALVATFPPDAALPARWTIIGRVNAGNGILVDGSRWNEAGGWEHFRASLPLVFEQILNVTRPHAQLPDITTLMPRHRPVGRPRHRAKRQGFWPARGVRSDGVRERAVPALGSPGELMSASGQSWAKVHRTWLNFGRMVRSAMLTPWFAVSAGIVIATSLTLARPHPALTFPPSKGGRCIQAGCAAPSTAPSDPAPAVKQGVRLPSRPGSAKVEYKLLRRKRNHFVAAILIVSHSSLNNWQLRFVWRGATIDDIWGATAWQPQGHGGVIVTGSRSPWQNSGDNEARIIVFGTASTRGTGGTGIASGRLGWPTGCELGNQRCTFRALPTNAAHESGSRESWRHWRADSVFGD
jgi:thiamine-monophosphate kinase